MVQFNFHNHETHTDVREETIREIVECNRDGKVLLKATISQYQTSKHEQEISIKEIPPLPRIPSMHVNISVHLHSRKTLQTSFDAIILFSIQNYYLVVSYTEKNINIPRKPVTI